MSVSSRASSQALRLFQSDALDTHLSLADLRYLAPADLVRLAQELRLRLRLLDVEVAACRCQSASGGVSARVASALSDLRHFLIVFEARVTYYRLRQRRSARQRPVHRSPRFIGVQEVA